MRLSELPSEAVRLLKLCVLDHFGCALGALGTEVAKTVLDAAAQASGNWAFAESGGMELYLAAGTAARNGIVAALLARCGFRGASDPLQAADGGFFTISSHHAKAEELTAALGKRFRLMDTCIKMYPTCHSTQTAIDAVLNLRSRHGVSPQAVERIVVRAGEITRVQCGWPFEPAPPARMIFHMGYALAVALARGKVLPADFEPESLCDPELRRIARSANRCRRALVATVVPCTNARQAEAGRSASASRRCMNLSIARSKASGVEMPLAR
ncbi:MAG: hypothetical protein A3G81_23450 [Betaproteobacteria bacterium RIFCSPLOWO2_12_FULL_65_14]|nr:MAG: hypothetical protein A3G81_23450 [Betaproteobacteria bacterium RIFCSPLOWO2_12_FULL_65_14]